MSWQDHAVIIVYLGAMIALGVHLSRQQRSDEEYFLAGRRMPWFAVGMSVIASLLSSLTYLSEPGEVWKSGVTHVFGKLLAIPVEMVIVWTFCIPFMMRFEYTTAYEYLEDRFGRAARRLGVGLFVLMVILWMGFVVQVSARALSQVSGIPLLVVILSVGCVATVYTILGGLRAVIWTDVVQVLLLVGGGLFTIGYVATTTGSGPTQWYAAATGYLAASNQPHSLPWFSPDPFVRATVVTVAINMCIWHVCTHTANQMTVQRYFSTSSPSAARRSFVTASLFSVGINLMLTTVGLAVLYYYIGRQQPLTGQLDPATQRDLIFPTFAVNQLPAGLGGAILAALLAAAMSSIDSGINSIATVLSVEAAAGERIRGSANHVTQARWITLLAGAFITLAAYGLGFLPDEWGIVGAMPRTFNAITAPLGSLFLVGMFLPWVGQRAVIAAALCSLVTSIGLGYYVPLAEWINGWGLDLPVRSISFTWIMPSSLLVAFATAAVLGIFSRSAKELAGLTWYTRDE